MAESQFQTAAERAKYFYSERRQKENIITNDSFNSFADFQHICHQINSNLFFFSNKAQRPSGMSMYEISTKMQALLPKPPREIPSNSLLFLRSTIPKFVSSPDQTAASINNAFKHVEGFLDFFPCVIFPSFFYNFVSKEALESGYNLLVFLTKYESALYFPFFKAFLSCAYEFSSAVESHVQSMIAGPSPPLAPGDVFSAFVSALSFASAQLSEFHIKALNLLQTKSPDDFPSFFCHEFLGQIVSINRLSFHNGSFYDVAYDLLDYASVNPKSPHYSMIYSALFTSNQTLWRPSHLDITSSGRTLLVTSCHAMYVYYQFLKYSVFVESDTLKIISVPDRLKWNLTVFPVEISVPSKPRKTSNNKLFFRDLNSPKPPKNINYSRLFETIKDRLQLPFILPHPEEVASLVKDDPYLTSVVNSLNTTEFSEYCASQTFSIANQAVSKVESSLATAFSSTLISEIKEHCSQMLHQILQLSFVQQFCPTGNLRDTIQNSFASPSFCSSVNKHLAKFPSLAIDKNAEDLSSLLMTANFNSRGVRKEVRSRETEINAFKTVRMMRVSQFEIEEKPVASLAKKPRRNSGDFSMGQLNKNMSNDINKVLEANTSTDVKKAYTLSRIDVGCTDDQMLGGVSKVYISLISSRRKEKKEDEDLREIANQFDLLQYYRPGSRVRIAINLAGSVRNMSEIMTGGLSQKETCRDMLEDVITMCSGIGPLLGYVWIEKTKHSFPRLYDCFTARQKAGMDEFLETFSSFVCDCDPDFRVQCGNLIERIF